MTGTNWKLKVRESKDPNIPEGLWLEKRWGRGEEGKSRLKVALELSSLAKRAACLTVSIGSRTEERASMLGCLVM